MPEVIDYLNLNEIKALLNEIDDTRDRAIILLFLNTGLFLNELVALKNDSIDWDKKILKVSGSRKRDIPLNDQVYEALAAWSKERPDARTPSFFITTKGKVKELSDRAVDKLIRKYADQAGLKRKVNAQILRNTFAVRLFHEEVAQDKAKAILGITDPQSINRYINAAKNPPPTPEPSDIEKLDTRPKIVKLISRAFPTKPKIAKPVTKIKGPIVPSPEEVIFGRDHVIEDISKHINREESVLIFGQIGIGKTHILKHLATKHTYEALYISSPSPMKNTLAQICDRLNPDWRRQVKSRASTKELLDYLVKTKGSKRLTLLLDNLNTLKASDIEAFLVLRDNFTIIGATDDTIPRLKQVWWKFIKLEIRPLSNDAARELIKYLTQNLSVSDYEMLETRVITLSNCLPLAIVDMIHQISHQPVITRDVIRDVYHEAGIKYRDWTPFLIVLWGLAMVFRFVALGTHSFEGYIMAGVGIAALMTTIRFLRMVK